MFLYTFAWIVADLATSNNYFLRNYGIFLTNWTEVAGCGHFFLSMLVVAYGYHVRKEDQNQQGWWRISGCSVIVLTKFFFRCAKLAAINCNIAEKKHKI